MEVILIVSALTLLSLFLAYRWVKERERVERVFYARGYVYVQVHLISGEVHKGFITRAQLRVIRSRSTNMTVTLESYTTGNKRIISTAQVDWIKQLRPPE